MRWRFTEEACASFRPPSAGGIVWLGKSSLELDMTKLGRTGTAKCAKIRDLFKQSAGDDEDSGEEAETSKKEWAEQEADA